MDIWRTDSKRDFKKTDINPQRRTSACPLVKPEYDECIMR